jgi:hypothetical protein
MIDRRQFRGGRALVVTGPGRRGALGFFGLRFVALAVEAAAVFRFLGGPAFLIGASGFLALELRFLAAALGVGRVAFLVDRVGFLGGVAMGALRGKGREEGSVCSIALEGWLCR